MASARAVCLTFTDRARLSTRLLPSSFFANSLLPFSDLQADTTPKSRALKYRISISTMDGLSTGSGVLAVISLAIELGDSIKKL